jgi:hypothetical protein
MPKELEEQALDPLLVGSPPGEGHINSPVADLLEQTAASSAVISSGETSADVELPNAPAAPTTTRPKKAKGLGIRDLRRLSRDQYAARIDMTLSKREAMMLRRLLVEYGMSASVYIRLLIRQDYTETFKQHMAPQVPGLMGPEGEE